MALKKLLRRLTPLDRGIVIFLLLAAGCSFGLLEPGAAGKRVVVERDGRVVFTAPLTENRTVELNGPLGETELAIRHGGARILSSPCPHKVCMGMGEAVRVGDFIACVPNHLLVRVEGSAGEGRGYDLLSR